MLSTLIMTVSNSTVDECIDRHTSRQKSHKRQHLLTDLEDIVDKVLEAGQFVYV
jgi:hypothetical protein